MDIFYILGIGLVAAVLALVLKQHRPEYALLVSLAAGALILFRVIGYVEPVVAEIGTILRLTELPMEYTEVLFKSLGICFVTQIACDTCKDAGETAISTKLEIAGKLAVLVISLPLFSQVLKIVSSLIG